MDKIYIFYEHHIKMIIYGCQCLDLPHKKTCFYVAHVPQAGCTSHIVYMVREGEISGGYCLHQV